LGFAPVDSTKTAGQRLSDDLTGDADPYAITVMIVEACRIADRLENLDVLIADQQTQWALAEARQQATVLRQLLAEIQRQRGQSRSAASDDDLAGL
jgi:hypothetical protein